MRFKMGAICLGFAQFHAHQVRRNSPSVTANKPTCFCLSISFKISASSILCSCSIEHSPHAHCLRANLIASGRKKLPTISKR